MNGHVNVDDGFCYHYSVRKPLLCVGYFEIGPYDIQI